jgi:hypothetical protein
MRRRSGYAGPARTGIAVIACAWGVASAATSPAPLAFADVTSVAGITYTGPSWSVAWADADKDALPDLFVGNHGAPHNLFLNRGTGRFAEIESWRLERAASMRMASRGPTSTTTVTRTCSSWSAPNGALRRRPTTFS